MFPPEGIGGWWAGVNKTENGCVKDGDAQEGGVNQRGGVSYVTMVRDQQGLSWKYFFLNRHPLSSKPTSFVTSIPPLSPPHLLLSL